jgi:hypothetical protein
MLVAPLHGPVFPSVKCYEKWISAVVVALGLLVGPAAGAEIKICRGIVMDNWTDGVADFTANDETRLIMPIDSEKPTVNDACLFTVKSEAGRKILGVCQMGFPCKARVRLSDEPADVFIIDRVLSVVNIGKSRRR